MGDAVTPNLARVPAARAAWEALAAGNARFVSGEMRHGHQDAGHRARLLEGQHPHAAVLGCADARIAPEVIFDQGLGDLFVIRVAGNIVTPCVTASIEYAAAGLETALVLVLGHSDCGAIAATATGKASAGQLPVLAAELAPAVAAATGDGAARMTAAAQWNARRMAARLAASEPLLAPRVRAATLAIMPAYYDQTSGRVSLLSQETP